MLMATFETSYGDFETYPEKLLYAPIYKGALQTYSKRLSDVDSRLFTRKDAEVTVNFRDYLSPNHGFRRKDISDDDSLRRWLDHDWAIVQTSTVSPAGLQSPNGSGQTIAWDPKCRFIFIRGGNARAPLQIKKKMLLRLLSYHQVMSSFLDFVLAFGAHALPPEIRFSGFREQNLLSHPGKLKWDALGRSGKQYQIAFNLKTAGLYPDPSYPHQEFWTIRQAAFHHQFDADNGTSLWIVVKGDWEIRDRVQQMTGPQGRKEDRSFGTPAECFVASLSVHLLLCDWSAEQWRWYLKSLEDSFGNETHLVLETPRNRQEAAQVYSFDNLQRAQRFEDDTNEVIMVLDANNDILRSLQSFYHHLAKADSFPLRQTCSGHIESFSNQVDGFIKDMQMQISRAKLLAQVIAARKTIILQHLQSQATETMETLTVRMNVMTEIAQGDARVVLIIAVVTLVYLPATFVSTFFSTDVVKYQSDENTDLSTYAGRFSLVALERWLQVTLPLTVLTLAAAYISYKRLAGRTQAKLQSLFQ